MEKIEILKEIASQVAICNQCDLHLSRKKGVPGEGPANSEIMLIGEGPGFNENEQGRPFVGAAGKLLNELLGQAGLSREQVFITNVVKCRPPGNRDPQPNELEACAGYLDRQIETINPRIIITLGRFSMAKFLPQARISQVHGQASWINERFIIPMYHPAAALHQPALLAVIKQDFAKIPESIHKAREAASIKEKSEEIHDLAIQKGEEKPIQLSLF